MRTTRVTPSRRTYVYREISEGTRFGRLDERRMIVSGPARNVARYLAALPRVLAGLEAAATRAARPRPRRRARAGGAGQDDESEALTAEGDEHQEHDDPTGEARAELTGADHTQQVTGPPTSSRSPHRSGGIPFGIRRGCLYGSISTRARPRRRSAPAAPPSRPRRRTTRGTGHRARAVSHEKGTCA
ncbi:hypothetical protein [Streptomyces sp. CC53]|uniref:hypothetical protein n=1 Tax=Streptomyces sp. CC53 TaxID=1906740 RepID=UPI000A8BF8F5|nr:hypothetical protein [Streptomyces sp. CC53]